MSTKTGGGSLPRPEPQVIVSDIGPGKVLETPRWRISAANAQHVEPWLLSLAYRLETDGLTITFAGDTGLCGSVLQLARGSDVVVVNCWGHQSIMEANGEAPGQTGTMDAATIGRESGAKKLILTHTGKRMTAQGLKEKAIAEISRHYDGQIIFGQELMRVSL